MGISVIIPCLNEEKHIEECILSIIQNGYKTDAMEVLVIDGGSNDQTLTILSDLKNQYPCIFVIHNLKQKTPFALNLGIANARFEKIMIAGAHATYPEGYLQHFDQLTNQPGIDVAGGSLETVPSDYSPKSRAIAYVLSHPFGVGNSAFRVGTSGLTRVDTVPFGIYRRKVFEKAGVYNDKLIRNHDIELSKRIAANGFQIWLDPAFKCTYFARSSFQKLMQNNFKNGYWNIRAVMLTKTLKSLSFRHFIPLLFILALLVPIFAALFLGFWVIWLSDLILISYLTILFIKCSLLEHKPNIHLVLSAFVSLHFSYGFGSLLALLTFWEKD
jgi:glycosyltransferase involved in cell wall biosynthesis